MATRSINPADATALPLDVRMMNATAFAIGVVAAALVVATAVLWLARLPTFAIRSISVEGDVTRNSVATIRANVASKLAGNLLTMTYFRGTRKFGCAYQPASWRRRSRSTARPLARR